MDRMELPVAVFDSGLGGVSVLRELIKCMPSEDFYYYGDSLHAPYGTKSLSEVQRLTLAHTEDFLAMGIKGLVVACNTATSAAVALLREKYPQLPLVGIEPAVKPAVEMYPRGNILVMATPMTIREKKLHHLIETYGGQANVIPLSCPGLMDFVEVGNIDSPEVSGFLRDLLEPYRGQVDAVVLGCTHYPFVRHSIEKILGPDTRIFDGGEGTAKEMKRRLKAAKLYCENPQKKGEIIFDNSDKSHEKKSQFWKLLNY